MKRHSTAMKTILKGKVERKSKRSTTVQINGQYFKKWTRLSLTGCIEKMKDSRLGDHYS